MVFAALVQPGTFDRFSIQLITALAGCLLVASLGQNLVVMLGSVDLSVPALMTLAAALNVHLVGSMGGIESFIVTLVVCSAISALSGALITYLRVNALIVTFSMNAIVAASLLVWLGQSFSSTGTTADWLHSFATGTWLHVSMLFWVALMIAAATAAVLSRTRPGRRVAAVGANRTAARMLGSRVGLVTTISFAVAGSFYALAGLFVAGLVQTPNPGLGNPYQLTTITVVAIAGTSFIGGSSSIAALLAATLLLTTLNQVLALQNLSAGALYMVQGALLVVAVSLSSWSSLGRSGLQRMRAAFGTIRTPA
ncbi:ABC transporter permease [Rhodococcus opacus]|nr:ABC transporter permease [Rhodococcus opacus]WKN60230.1 ABC transporter permease [Rhodococcus opacus]